MKDMNMKARIRVMSFVMLLAVFAVWAVFYSVISSYIADNTEKQMTMAAGQIIEKLGGEFALAERLSYNLTNSADVKDLVSSNTPELKYPLIEQIGSQFSERVLNSDLIEHIIIFGGDSDYIRLTGRLGNKSCARLSVVVSALRLPGHLTIDLEGKKYIGYADAIVTGNGGIQGSVAILIEEEKILEILRTYDQSGSLFVAVIANGEVIAANTDKIALFTANASGQPVIHSGLGITPYEIAVAADAGYMNASVVYFTIVAVVTAALFGLVLFMYSRVLNRRFFRPMVQVIGSIENLNADITDETLPHVESAEFDGLIDKINEMLVTLETKNNKIKNAELRAKNAEIEKQKALVFALKKQINAHFTLNTLNTIRIFVEEGELEKAETVSMGLISLIRYAYDKDELINIWDEFAILQKYIAIMNARYAGKLNVDFDFDDRLMDYSMPRMLLQPILENSVTHGFKNMDDRCEISVRAELRGEAIRFLISDNGCGMSEEELTSLVTKLDAEPEAADGYESIALLNIRNRLYHYYGGAGQIKIQPGGTIGIEVSIIIPASKETGGLI